MTDWLGKQIGKCRIDKKIGAGGMGTVYKAKHLMLDKDVALKVLHSELIVEETGQIIIERFLREARSAAKLEHVNVVSIYDVGEEHGIYYIVMQFIEGMTLLQEIERNGICSVHEVLRIARKISNGLQMAHEQGIIHRDIKPANIIIANNTREVKITDFGMARQVDDDSGISQTGRVFGTPLYLSPEQAMGDKKLDARADLYAMGCTIHHALTGSPPYTGNTSFVIMQHHVYSPLPKICVKYPHVPVEIEYFIHKLMAKKREERFGSAREVIDYIDRLENSYFAKGFSRPKMNFPKTQKNIPRQKRVSRPTEKIKSNHRTKKRTYAAIVKQERNFDAKKSVDAKKKKAMGEDTKLKKKLLQAKNEERLAKTGKKMPQIKAKGEATKLKKIHVGTKAKDPDSMKQKKRSKKKERKGRYILVDAEAKTAQLGKAVGIRGIDVPASPPGLHDDYLSETDNRSSISREEKIRIQIVGSGVECITEKKPFASPPTAWPKKKETMLAKDDSGQQREMGLQSAEKTVKKTKENVGVTPLGSASEGKDRKLLQNTPENPLSCARKKVHYQEKQNWRKGLLSPNEWIFLIVFVLGCLILFGIFVFGK